MPSVLAHVREANRVDPVGGPARAAQVLLLDIGRGSSCFSWPVSSSAPEHQVAEAVGTTRCVLQVGHRELGAPRHRGGDIARSPVEQPLCTVRARAPEGSAIVQP